MPIRHLADFQGKKLRIFASDFQSVALKRLGAAPVAMTLGDVLPAIQQGTIDGAIAALNVFVPMHYVDAAKYVTETNYLLRHRGQPEMVRLAAARFAAGYRQGWQRRNAWDRSMGDRFSQQDGPRLAGPGWRTHQSAAGRAGKHDEDLGDHR